MMLCASSDKLQTAYCLKITDYRLKGDHDTIDTFFAAAHPPAGFLLRWRFRKKGFGGDGASGHETASKGPCLVSAGLF